MLIEIQAVCPACGHRGPIRVSDASGHGSATTCKGCGERIVALTLPDGHVGLQVGEAIGLASLHGAPSGGPDGAPDPGPGDRAVVLPPERFGLRSAEYGVAPRFAGMSDEDFETQAILPMSADVLFRPDGSRRPDDVIVARIGWRGLWLAQVGEEIAQRLAGPAPMTFPPKVFLSYRWQSDAENAWVENLGLRLKARGYDVFRDRDLPQDRPPNVPDITSRVADCRYFVAMVDPGYLARIGRRDDGRMEDGWVFDEFQLASALSNAGLVRLVGFWRGGDLPGPPFRLAAPGTPGNLIDVRTPEKLDAVVDQVFPALPDLAESGSGEAARAAIGRSHRAVMEGDAATAVREAATVADHVPVSADGWLQIVRIVHRTGDHALGLQAAEAALALHPTSIELLLDAAVFAAATGAPHKAAAFAARVLDQEPAPADLGEAHAHMASALDDLGRVDAALGHARAAARLGPDRSTNVTNLGYLLRRIGDVVSAAETLSAGLRKFPQDRRLLENYAAAVAEAGLLDQAEQLIMHLHRTGGGDNAVGALARAVMEARETGRPPVLVEQADLPAAVAFAACDDCGTRILLAEGERDLCAMCGAPGQPADGPCGYCAARGRLPLLAAGAAMRCPFCRQGALARHALDEAGGE